MLDSGAFTMLSERSRRALALIDELRTAGLWPPLVPTVVLAESLQGHAGRDAAANRLLKIVHVDSEVPLPVARRAGELRRAARRGSVVDALVVALAEPAGVVLTGDGADVSALAAHAGSVGVVTV